MERKDKKKGKWEMGVGGLGVESQSTTFSLIL